MTLRKQRQDCKFLAILGHMNSETLSKKARRWWHTPLALALWTQRQLDLYVFQASLVYRAAKDTQKNPIWGLEPEGSAERGKN